MSGDILKATNTDFPGGYNVWTKDDFEDDGSVIIIVAPTSETLSAYDREVKIAWSKAGDDIVDSDYTTYTFDLSNATLEEH